jgi:dihydroflavonol-4-reductase
MRVLVTGATGFVGSVLMPRLVEQYGREAVSAFVLPGDRLPETWSGAGIEVVEGDIADAPAVARAAAGKTHVVHLAGLISYWKGDLEKLTKVNRDGAAAMVEACLEAGTSRLVHISSVGAVGFHKDGTLADEETPFNWPPSILYMASKRAGEEIVETAIRERGLRAVILNPASIMGPGDHDPRTPHNRLYRSICCGRLLGSFSGGLAVVDVRDLVAIILRALEGAGREGERYLVVGGNLSYPEVIRMIASACGKRAFPVALPVPLVAAAGGVLEGLSALTGKRPLLTSAYGRLSGWRAYYDNSKSVREFGHSYLPLERTIRDGWEYFRDRHAGGSRADRRDR